ncbi:hypothetical protein PI125_g10913 [Phytophthora idaei]|nr:hypothetical protein PI125_g10913 [Phytophthora idaei]
MSFRGGRGGARGGRGGRGGGRGGFREPEGPPAFVVELGSFMHACENEMVYKSSNDKVPYFNAGAFLENKTRIGKVDEILGSINEVMFTVKPDAGVSASSFQAGDKVFISPDKLLPLSRFTEKPGKKPAGAGGRGGGRGGRVRIPQVYQPPATEYLPKSAEGRKTTSPAFVSLRSRLPALLKSSVLCETKLKLERSVR